ncbi:hypothetical protein [Methanimicrococcus blatticola]|uniref:hypothetical protein n=1 Tax=Methanimicrococcus blatticola TaxID=91560 RepID=UPI001414F4CC|nr:hypothetical protein [Methanimicrococcus blatticola]
MAIALLCVRCCVTAFISFFLSHPFAFANVPPLPSVRIAAATFRSSCCCYLPFELPLPPSVQVAVATFRSNCRCYLPFELPAAAGTGIARASCCIFNNCKQKDSFKR